MMKKLAVTALGLAMVFSGSSAFALMASGTANYSITLVNGCAIDTTGATTDFGVYPVDTADFYGISAGSILVNCTAGTSYMVGVNNGLNGMAYGGNMVNGLGTQLQYELLYNGAWFGDSGLNAIDGSYVESDIDPGISDVGISAPVVYNLTANVYTATAMGQPGIYTDTLTFTVVW